MSSSDVELVSECAAPCALGALQPVPFWTATDSHARRARCLGGAQDLSGLRGRCDTQCQRADWKTHKAACVAAVAAAAAASATASAAAAFALTAERASSVTIKGHGQNVPSAAELASWRGSLSVKDIAIREGGGGVLRCCAVKTTRAQAAHSEMVSAAVLVRMGVLDATGPRITVTVVRPTGKGSNAPIGRVDMILRAAVSYICTPGSLEALERAPMLHVDSVVHFDDRSALLAGA